MQKLNKEEFELKMSSVLFFFLINYHFFSEFIITINFEKYIHELSGTHYSIVNQLLQQNLKKDVSTEQLRSSSV